MEHVAVIPFYPQFHFFAGSQQHIAVFLTDKPDSKYMYSDPSRDPYVLRSSTLSVKRFRGYGSADENEVRLPKNTWYRFIGWRISPLGSERYYIMSCVCAVRHMNLSRFRHQRRGFNINMDLFPLEKYTKKNSHKCATLDCPCVSCEDCYNAENFPDPYVCPYCEQNVTNQPLSEKEEMEITKSFAMDNNNM